MKNLMNTTLILRESHSVLFKCQFESPPKHFHLFIPRDGGSMERILMAAFVVVFHFAKQIYVWFSIFFFTGYGGPIPWPNISQQKP